MAKTLPPLARSVLVGSTAYRIGDIPPLKHAKKITNPRNWEGGETPDFENGGFEDGVETVDGIGNSDAANAGRSGLPGFDSNGQPKQLVRETTGEGQALLTRTGDEGAGTGAPDPETGQGGGSTGEGSKGEGVNSPDGDEAGTGDSPEGDAETNRLGATATAAETEAGTTTTSRRRAAKATAQQ